MIPMKQAIAAHIKSVFPDRSGCRKWTASLSPCMKNGPVKILITFILVMVVGLAHAATYYSAAGTTDPAVVGSWWTNTNGTGSHPANFTNPADIFILQSGHI